MRSICAIYNKVERCRVKGNDSAVVLIVREMGDGQRAMGNSTPKQSAVPEQCHRSQGGKKGTKTQFVSRLSFVAMRSTL